jgi:hypothetical protein
MRSGLYIILLFLYASCGGPAHNGTAEATPVADTLHHYDTLFFDHHTVLFTPITSTDFDKLSDQGFAADGPNVDTPLIQRDKEFISKKDSTLTIQCTNHQVVKLTEQCSCDGDDYIDYTYGGRLGNTPFLVFKVGYYEKLDYLLVNLNSGKKITTWGAPELSPDGKTLIASSFDLDVGFLPNGIQYFSVGPDSLQLIWERKFETWGPEEVKWSDSQTLYVKQSTPVGSEKNKIIEAYAKVQLGR